MLGAGQHPDVGFPRPFPSVSICEICVICGYSTFPFVDWPRSLSVYASCWYSPLAFACFSCKCGGSVRGNQAELKGLKESAGNLEGRIDGAARYFPLDRWGLRSQCGFAGRGVGQSLTFDVGPSLLLSGVVGTQDEACRDLHLIGHFKIWPHLLPKRARNLKNVTM